MQLCYFIPEPLYRRHPILTLKFNTRTVLMNHAIQNAPQMHMEPNCDRDHVGATLDKRINKHHFPDHSRFWSVLQYSSCRMYASQYTLLGDKNSRNHFNALACKISGLKSAHIHAWKQYIWWCYNKSTFNIVHFARSPALPTQWNNKVSGCNTGRT